MAVIRAERGMLSAPQVHPPEPQPPLGLMARIQKFLQPKTSPDLLPVFTNVGVIQGALGMVNQNAALVRTPTAETNRAYSMTPWVFSAINIRCDQIAASEWDIVAYDDTKPVLRRQQDALRDLFASPSAKLNSFQTFAKTVIAELLTLDASPIEKVRYPGTGEIGELWPTRGDWIMVDERWDGSEPNRPRYYFAPDGTVRARFKNEDMIYLVANPRANTSLGISPMSVLQAVIESELQALGYNRRQVMGAAPDGAFYLGDNATAEDVQRAESKFESQVYGQSAMTILGGYKDPKWFPFRSTNRDMQFREWEDLLIRCIAVVLGLSPMDLGITFDVNRSTAEQQGANTEDRGQRPLMSLFQSYMTREVVWDKGFGGKRNNLMFAFKDLNLSESQAKANINKVAMPGIGWKVINEARRMEGRKPIGDPDDEDNIFNHILVGTPKGILDISTQQYVGEGQLARIQTDAKINVAEEVAKFAPDPAPAPGGGSGD